MKVNFSFKQAGKISPNDPFIECVTPRFGRYWFYWLPHFKWNKGLPWKNEVLDVGFYWLFYTVDMVLWPSCFDKKGNGISKAP